MSSVVALMGMLATVSLIAASILAYHMIQMQRELDTLRETLRAFGRRIGAPIHELPPERPIVDEWAPDAVVDTTEVDREWKLPRSLRRD